jgi:hypothetical protein
MQTGRFHWFILISLMIHTMLLWLFHFIPLHELKSFQPLEVALLNTPSSSQQETHPQRNRTRQATSRTTPLQRSTRATPFVPSAKKSEVPSSIGEPSSRDMETSVAPGGASSDTAAIAPGSEGISTGGGGSSSGSGRTSSSAGGSPTGTKGGSAGSERDAFSGVEIPPYVIDAAGFRSRFDAGGIYPETDSYVLYGDDKKIGIPVPGTEVCVEGDQLRTKERMTLTEIRTDYSKCRALEFGDDVPPKIICPPEAETRIVNFNHYASSPLVYRVSTCLEYDWSHCYEADAGGEGDRWICPVDFKYEGIWAVGTIFAYKCAKSEIRTYRHPLQYDIRWIMEVEINDRLRKRQIYRETKSVPPCN